MPVLRRPAAGGDEKEREREKKRERRRDFVSFCMHSVGEKTKCAEVCRPDGAQSWRGRAWERQGCHRGVCQTEKNGVTARVDRKQGVGCDAMVEGTHSRSRREEQIRPAAGHAALGFGAGLGICACSNEENGKSGRCSCRQQTVLCAKEKLRWSLFGERAVSARAGE